MTLTHQKVLVTGASQGIGKALSRYFMAKGYTVIGCSRGVKPSDFQGEWIQADVTRKEDLENIVSQLKICGPLTGLVNNAGIGYYDTWEHTTEDTHSHIFELNYFAPVNLTLSCLKSGVLKKGFIVNISSVAGVVPVACMGPYCASKFALRCFSKSLNMELADSIHVLTALVGRIDTGFSSRALGTLKPPSTPGGGDADKLAKRIFEGVSQKKGEILYPKWYQGVFFIEKMWPSLYRYYNRKKWKL